MSNGFVAMLANQSGDSANFTPTGDWNMPNTRLHTVHSRKLLPSPPDTSSVLAATTIRLEAIRTTAPGVAREHHALLERVWYSPDVDHNLIHIHIGLAIPCHPAGADRLAAAGADEEALIREEAALSE